LLDSDTLKSYRSTNSYRLCRLAQKSQEMLSSRYSTFLGA